MTGAFEDLWSTSQADADPYFEERKQKLASYSGAVTDFANVNILISFIQLYSLFRTG